MMRCMIYNYFLSPQLLNEVRKSKKVNTKILPIYLGERLLLCLPTLHPIYELSMYVTSYVQCTIQTVTLQYRNYIWEFGRRSTYFFKNIWWPMPLFLDIYFIYRYRYYMEVDEEKTDTYNISVGVCLWFCRPDVVLKLGCIGAVLMWLY
jgi:hypothetical protein